MTDPSGREVERYVQDDEDRVSASINLEGQVFLAGYTAEAGCREILPTARALVFDAAAALPLRLSAIAALRRLGTPFDLASLRAIAATNADERLAPSLSPLACPTP